MNRSHRVHFTPGHSRHIAILCVVAAICVSCSGGGSSSSASSSGTSAPSGSGGSGGSGSSGGASAMSADVLTYHNDVARTGQYLAETTLTPSNVNAASFGKVAFLSVDGKVDAQPLFVSNVPVNGAAHNVIYVVTEHASVYAFDADSNAQLWQRSLLGSGETTSDPRNCTQISPEIGITATPVIDRSRGSNGVMYAVAMSKEPSGTIHQRLHAVDLASGAELFGGPVDISGSYPGSGANSSNGVTTFDPQQYAERQALTLVNGKLYLGWTSHCDQGVYGGWVMAYNADTLAQTSALNLTPNGTGGAVWMGGGGMASDGTSVYLLDANGTFDTTLNGQGFPSNGNFGNAFIKLGTSGNLSVADYFATFDTVAQSANDADLGSGAAIVLPDLVDGSGATRHLALGSGKDSKIYVVDRDNMGKFNSGSNAIWQEIDSQLIGGVFTTPAFFGNVVYYGSVGDNLKAFPISGARLATTPSSQSAGKFPYPGTTPSISANGSANAIVWAAENGTTAALHAFNAANLAQELYNSNQSGSRDTFGAGNKYVTPMIAHGHVYVGTTNGVAVFGLLK
ncbi:pyrrolo-quinoline quinone [Paraburkholderia sp. Tr-20389]|uniref:pyrrolo-quinoline quinone n=1 Tax=Paraburkholderia sp. Tr-20389 TaxID=2703903 RepID=UPI00197DA3A0|nr:pyrrolo-quinoline quinone [Paraburkholderia sp. Tr-20389]MBN3753207.1 pyrrolo-quinoline quinone [Paraburkholderia sp. Tr-20389]